jgi:hypothetical protein
MAEEQQLLETEQSENEMLQIMQSINTLAEQIQMLDEQRNADHGEVINAASVIKDQLQGSAVVGVRKIKDEQGNLIGAVKLHADGSETPVQIQ